MKIDLSENEIRIIKRALSNRVQDLSYYSRECESKGQRACMVEFAEMANECDAVLNKFEKNDE